jgi:hypothetical protein
MLRYAEIAFLDNIFSDGTDKFRGVVIYGISSLEPWLRWLIVLLGPWDG